MDGFQSWGTAGATLRRHDRILLPSAAGADIHLRSAGTSMTVPDGPLTVLMEEVRRRYDSCFACGPANPHGLRLDGFTVDGGEVVAAWKPGHEFNGFQGVLHGGVVAAALDEICAWAAMAFESTLVVTGRFEVRYVQRAPTAAEYELRARVDVRRGSRLRLSGRMLHDGGTVASASGLYLATGPTFGE